MAVLSFDLLGDARRDWLDPDALANGRTGVFPLTVLRVCKLRRAIE